ncbi:hypothetical protein COV17_03865 [Candidatus Woesearchaeota archaeon CG10_big_fil_rev_8_21_14_0_10_36_11]|nr:MAG: hypothetical protein COV17_03865 [Candidatus Woesearchaeota archaeon CG10_big_fil_rev_8_21_14_0_10_36_11]
MKKEKKDLEETIKGKVVPLLEETMEKNLGVNIPKIESDITDKLQNPHLDIYIPFNLHFKDAKKSFKKEFIKQELGAHLGNISELAKVLGLDRRSIHRTIKKLNISIDKVRVHMKHTEEDIIDKTIRSTLAEYKEIIHPQKMERMYEDVPTLSRNIAKFLPHKDFTWKEAENEFEKRFLSKALQDSQGNVAKAAAKVDIRVETLHRKIKKLRLK